MSAVREFEALVNRKDLCSPKIYSAWLRAKAEMDTAFDHATWDLAVHTFRGKDISLGEEAERLRAEYRERAAA